MYKVEAYVERCIRTLEKQNIPEKEYEIICINDGSPDNCSFVVKELQREFSNIRLIEQENQGVSRARNNGIDLALGQYLLFVDPDDFVDNNSLGSVLEFADYHDSDVTFLGFTVLNEDGTLRKHFFNEELKTKIFSGPDAYFYARGDGRTDPDRMWAVLFKLDLINSNNLRYLPNVPFLEDGELITRILCLAKRCSFTGRSFYQRTTRPGSATNSKLFFSDRATNGFFLCASNLLDFQQTMLLCESQYRFLNQAICKFTILIVDPARDPLLLFRRKKIMKRLKQNNLLKLDLHSVDNEFTLLGKWYNRSVLYFIARRFLSIMIKSLKFRFRRAFGPSRGIKAAYNTLNMMF